MKLFLRSGGHNGTFRDSGKHRWRDCSTAKGACLTNRRQRTGREKETRQTKENCRGSCSCSRQTCKEEKEKSISRRAQTHRRSRQAPLGCPEKSSRDSREVVSYPALQKITGIRSRLFQYFNTSPLFPLSPVSSADG